MMAAMPPRRGTAAIVERQKVVLPDDSGPKKSAINSKQFGLMIERRDQSDLFSAPANTFECLGGEVAELPDIFRDRSCPVRSFFQ